MKKTPLEIINIKNAGKSLFGKLILSNVSLSVRQGDIIGITGPIGAGKSTLLYILSGILDLDGGSLSVFSQSFSQHRTEILQRMNYASAGHRLSGYATVQENLCIYALLYGKTLDVEKISHFFHHFEINPKELLRKKVYRLSSGENSLVNLCKAFINTPELLLLDEITTHFDPVTAETAHSYLKTYASSGKTIVLVSQNLDEIRSLCSRVVVLVRGHIRYVGTSLSTRKITTYYE